MKQEGERETSGGADSGLSSRRGAFALPRPKRRHHLHLFPLSTGPSKLPSLGKELGKTAKSFQTAAKEFEKELKAGAEEAEAEAKKDE